MIYKCPNCNGALEYNPVTDEMECAHCGGSYTMQEINTDEPYIKEEQNQNEQEISASSMERELSGAEEELMEEMETMECKIYTCTSCGGELAVSNTEVSTYCAYCGQPTIIYSRVSKTRKPKYIIPFCISQEEAVEKLHNHFRRKFLMPKKAKKINLETIKGIYLPCFLFDVYYHDTVVYKASKNSSYKIEAKCDLQRVAYDASKVVEDEFAHFLEPYCWDDLKEFDGAYLSGFYAECNDLSARQLTNAVKRRCKELYEDELRRVIKRKVSFKSTDNVCEIIKAEYTFLPVWFMTFRWKNEPYTMMVNGQTGKVVGSLPVSKKRATLIFMLFFLIALAAVLWIGFGLYNAFTDDFSRMMTPFLMLHATFIPIVLFLILSIRKFSKIKKNHKITTLTRTERFVKERQEIEQ